MTRIRGAGRQTFRSLQTRNFRIYFVGQIISGSGSWMQQVAQIWLVLKLTDSGIALGVTTALQFLPVLLGGAWAGVLADRMDKRKLLIAIIRSHRARDHAGPADGLRRRRALDGLRPGHGARLRDRARQSGPPLLRHRAGAGGARGQRGQPQQLDLHRVPHRRPGALAGVIWPSASILLEPAGAASFPRWC